MYVLINAVAYLHLHCSVVTYFNVDVSDSYRENENASAVIIMH